MVCDRRGFISSATKVLQAQGLHCLAWEVVAPPDEELEAMKGNRLAAAAAVAREVARVISSAAGEAPAPVARKPRRPAGCLF